QRGGCAGMEYVMKIDSAVAGDKIFSEEGVNIIVDQESLPHLEGARIDYSGALSDAGFKVDNPNATRSCGCGSSFEAKTA
ncbi:MAG: iron-sulfur cluster assembly accessory protein, partial [Proteobacteria bacterium]|nr:iron-sulfur cluster assembly accessory protein [Pseudomonadota bacterium]